MSIEYRHSEILNILKAKKSVRINDLTAFFGVSNVTIRNDLDLLDKQGLLVKTHGGAVLKTDSASLFTFGTQDDDKYITAKNIVDLAFSTIEEGDCIFLGSGYTSYLLAERLKELNNISVVTNNVSAVSILKPSDINVFLLGGELIFYKDMISTSCYKSDELFKSGITINKAYTSILGIDLNAGLTVNYELSRNMYSTITKIASDWYLMVASNKFDKTSLYKVADINNVKCVISDKIPQSYKDHFDNNGIQSIMQQDNQ
jgi:DeoR/GlpR family transcriptional regulator of sugar metabolism